jgi:hypothetical protein
LAAVTHRGATVLGSLELRGIADTVAALREYQRDYIVRDDAPEAERDTGIRP